VVEAKVSGRVEQYQAFPGQTVRAGDLLVALDVGEIVARVDSATATLENADRELGRYRRLSEQNAVTRQELEAAEARQKVAAATLAEAKTLLGYARVTAPFDGVVTRKLADVGDLAMPGKALLEIESPLGLRFEADLPDALIDSVSIGQTMTVRVSGSDRELQGTVGEIAPVADPASRTFRVKLDLPEADGLRSGRFGRVAVPLAETEILAVPAAAVTRRGQLEGVFVVREGRAWLRLVKTGPRLGEVVVLLSGVDPGENLVAEVPEGLRDGQPVTTEGGQP
jgi:RND family efflux transporter MFP subunit